MKHIKKITALMLAMVLAMAMSMTVLAAEPSTPSITITAASTAAEGQTDTTEYTWYRILDADIAEDPTSSGATQSDGKVSYYVTTQDRADQITGTGLFNVTRVGTSDKWYVELKDKSTTADAIATKFAAMDLTKFPTDTFAQTSVGGDATTGEVAPGYYYITSTAGKNVVIQTLTAVEIEEKNEFPTVKKEIDPDDANSQIGSIVTYTLTVAVPATANDTIVLTDTMDAGLTFNEVTSVKAGNDNVTYTLNPASPSASDKTFTITFAKADVIANQGKTIVITYKAMVNKDAAIETDIPNEVKLKYGNNYESKPSTSNTKTYKFTFDKKDGSTMLTGAEFTFDLDGTPMSLVEVEAGKEYRIATSEDTTTTTKIVTNGNTVTIKGLDLDEDGYTLTETKEPAGGYNKLEEPISVTAGDTTFTHQDVQNNKGSVLPSTGGIGTTIFYIIGAVLVVGAGVLMVTRRRMRVE